MQHSDAKSQQKTHALTQHWTHYWHAINNYQVSRFAITLTLQCSYCKTNIQTNYHYYLPMLWDYLEIKRLYFLIGPTPVSFQTFSHKNIIANFSRIKNSDRQSRRLTCQPLDLPPNRPYNSEPQPSFCYLFSLHNFQQRRQRGRRLGPNKPVLKNGNLFRESHSYRTR